MSKIYIPTREADEWKQFLAEPDKQWRTGFSAKTLANCWQAADGLPVEISNMLLPFGADPHLLIAIPEYKTPLPGASRGESQNDVFALVRAGEQTVALVVEGKVAEPFGEQVGDWLRKASEGKRKRLGYLCELLRLQMPLPVETYYQLLHRTASALIEARRFKTDNAVMIVHSFSLDKRWFEAFKQFASLFDAAVEPNKLMPIRSEFQPPLYIGWACGDCKFLTV